MASAWGTFGWHTKGKSEITVFSQDGQRSVPVLKTLKHIRALAFVQTICSTSPTAGPTRCTSSGAIPPRQPPLPAQLASPATTRRTAFTTKGIAVDSAGNFAIAQGLEVTGARLTRFRAGQAPVIWDHVGAEFTNTASISTSRRGNLAGLCVAKVRTRKTGLGIRGSETECCAAMRLQKLGETEFAVGARRWAASLSARGKYTYRPLM